MDVKYQVFVSSTFDDLQEERRVLMEQILNLRHIPVGMELFQAANQEQWAYIKKRILECDYYLLIVAERYGSLASDGKSYTQKEYEFAVANGIPIAAFLLAEDARKDWPSKHLQHERKAEIEAFRTLCSANKMVKFWKGAGDLALKATNALLGLIEEEPRPGWVRADQGGEAALRELAKLSEEKRELEEWKNAHSGSGEITATAEEARRLERLRSAMAYHYFDEQDGGLEQGLEEVSLAGVFWEIRRALGASATNSNLQSKISDFICVSGEHAYSTSRVIIGEFGALGLLATQIHDDKKYHSLSDLGKRVMLLLEDEML